MRDLGFDNTAIEHLKKLFPTKTIELMANEVEVENITTQAKKMKTLKERYDFFLVSSVDYDDDIRKKIDILAFIYKGYVFKKNDEWRGMSEYSIIIKLWSFIFETLFEQESDIRLLWGMINSKLIYRFVYLTTTKTTTSRI